MAASDKLSRYLLSGIGLRLLAAFLMTAMSAAVHGAAETAPTGQIIFWRSFVAIIPICIYMAMRGELREIVQTKRLGMHLSRGCVGLFSMAMSFISLAYLSVSSAQALAFLAPVFVLPIAAVTLGERLTKPTVIAVAIGFGGVVMLTWETLKLDESDGLIGIAAGLAFALSVALVRTHTKTMLITEKASTIAFYFALVGACAGLLTLPFGWTSLSSELTGWLVLSGLLGGLGHIAANEATARAPVSTLAPIDFTGLIWAVGFDIILFAMFPTPLGYVGVATITVAALIVTVAAPSRSARAASLRSR